MEKQSHNKFKIKYILLSILFMILFIFTALNISIPLTAYADTTTTIGQTMNLDSYSANEDDESTNEQAGYLYWAASSRRCGVMFYVVDEKGVVQTNGLIMDRAGRDEFGYYTNAALGKTPGIRGADATGKRVGGAILGAGVGMEDESLSEDVKLTTIKDGGDISLQDAINNVENGLPTDMYQTLARAVALGFITEDNLNWDEAITKSEAITLFIDAAETYQTNMEEVNNKMGLEETPPYEVVEQGDYPDSRSDHQANWDTYKKYFDDFSVYGTDTAGKGLNDLPYGGDTGYDPKGTILQERTTDKGYTVMYDTDTGKVYYSSMILPTGDVYLETESGGVLATYAYAKGYNNCYDITYDEMQEILGVYNGD